MNAPSELQRGFSLSPRSISVIGGLIFVLSTSFSSAAQQSREQGKRGGPPPEAFAACEAAVQEDACTVESKRGTINGTCQLDRRKKETLLCVPADRPARRGGESGSGDKDRPEPRPDAEGE